MTVSALRHRPRQALLIVALAAVVSAAAAMGPLYARAVEQSVLRNVVAGAPTSERGVVVLSTGTRPASPGELARTVAPETPPQFGTAIRGADTRVLVGRTGERAGAEAGAAARTRSTARLVSRSNLCRHVEIADGRCVQAEGEVLVSSRTASSTGIAPGGTVRVRPESAAEPGSTSDVGLDARVVGVYEPVDPVDPYWSGRGRAGTVDDLLTPWSTLAAAPWPQLRTHLDIPLDPDRVDLTGIAALSSATERIDRRARTADASATSGLGPLLTSAQSQRDQARTVIPLLTVQLAVLGIVVLTFICAAATEQRRPEIALARLRGLGTGGAAGMLLRELGVLVVVGAALGAGLGWLGALGASALWLEPGVVLEARWPVGAAVLAAALAGLLAIAAAGAPTLRQPLTSLLRRVPPRASAVQVGVVEGAVVAAAGAGLVTLLSGEGGPVALLAPGLLAIAGGLLLAQAVIPTAGPLARRSLRRGRVSWALACVQIARRPALRRLIAIVTVATALLVFAVDAWTVSDRNRTARAAIDAGAAVVLTVDAPDASTFRATLLDIDPDGRFGTPVVTTRSAAPVGPTSFAVEPSAFTRIANWGDPRTAPSPPQLAALTPDRVPALPVPPGRPTEFALRATFDLRPLPRPAGIEGNLQPLRLGLGLSGLGDDGFVDLGELRSGSHVYRGAAPCPEACHLSEFFVDRSFGDSYPAELELVIDSVRAGPAGSARELDLGPATSTAWQVVPFRSTPTSAVVRPGPPLAIRDAESFQSIFVRRGNIPAVTPAIGTGDLPKPFRDAPGGQGRLAVAPDLSGGEHLYSLTQRIPRVPRSAGGTVVVALETVDDDGATSTAQTSYDVWLASDDQSREQRLTRDLSAHGLDVVARDSAAEHRADFADEGPTLALRLAVLAGAVAVLLAAAVLVVGVATSGASRARDLAGLRLVGVPAATVRSAAVREHMVVATLGVLAGSALGVVAAHAALPRIPLFATPSERLPLALEPVWPAIAATVIGCLVLLCTVSVVVGRALAASATPARLREGG